jgi:hypothetical protein
MFGNTHVVESLRDVVARAKASGEIGVLFVGGHSDWQNGMKISEVSRLTPANATSFAEDLAASARFGEGAVIVLGSCFGGVYATLDQEASFAQAIANKTRCTVLTPGGNFRGLDEYGVVEAPGADDDYHYVRRNIPVPLGRQLTGQNCWYMTRPR